VTLAILLGVGLLVGVTTVLFGFGGGFVAVPVVLVADADLGADALRVSIATSTGRSSGGSAAGGRSSLSSRRAARAGPSAPCSSRTPSRGGGSSPTSR
jgi:uncharacterized membrane protein YfcA